MKREKNKEVELIAYERERQEAEIQRQTVIAAKEDEALEDRNKSSESVRLSTEFTRLQTRLALLNLEKDDAFATAAQEKEVASEQARILSEKQRFLLEERWKVEEEEITKELDLEKSQDRERSDNLN